MSVAIQLHMVIAVRVSGHLATRPPCHQENCHQEVDSPPTLFTDLSVLTEIPSFKAAITLCKCVNYLRGDELFLGGDNVDGEMV